MGFAINRLGKPSGKPGMSDEEVRRYRQAYADGKMTSREIREWTGLSGETVGRMLRGDTYSHVGMAKTEEEKAEVEREIQEGVKRLMEWHEKGGGKGEEEVIIMPVGTSERVRAQAELYTGKRHVVEGEDGDVPMSPNPMEE